MIRRYSQLHRTDKYSASLAKCLSVRLQTKWLWVQIPLQSLDLSFENGLLFSTWKEMLRSTQKVIFVKTHFSGI